MRRGKGEGSISKRKDGRWQARYQANGKRKYVYGRTRREVAKKLAAALSEINSGLVYDDKVITVRQHIGSWLSNCKTSVRISTW